MQRVVSEMLDMSFFVNTLYTRFHEPALCVLVMVRQTGTFARWMGEHMSRSEGCGRGRGEGWLLM